MATSQQRTRDSKRRSTSTPTVKSGKPLLGFVPEKYRSAAWIVLILLSLIVFFGGPIMNGEYFASNDNVSWESYRPYLEQMSEKGESPQWMPYIFSGMPGVPAYMVTGDREWDITVSVLETVQEVFSFLNQDIMRVLFYYFILGCGVFALLRWKGMSRSISFFASLALLFSTWIIVWIMIGHNTKPMVLAFLPWIILFLDRLLERWSFLDVGFLILAVHFLVESAHPQTAFYGMLVVLVWLLTELVVAVMRKTRDRTRGLVRAGLVGIAAACFAIGMGWDRFSVAVEEYTPYSTRGSDPIIEQEQQDPYEYATSWSFDVDETFTYIVPSYFGFGRLTFDVQGVRADQAIPTYWGNEETPFTDAAHYMGIIVLLLALFGAWTNRRNPFVLGLSIAGLLGLIISFGSNFPILYDLFYNIVPKFKQFRAPSQSLVMLEFVAPLIAAFGLSTIIRRGKDATNLPLLTKRFQYGAIGSGVFILLFFVVGSSWRSAFTSDPQIQRMSQSPQFQQIVDALYSMVQTDWILAGIFGGIFMLLAAYYLKGKVTASALVGGVILLTLIDLWRVDYRPMHENKPKDEVFSVFDETQADQWLKQDTSLYRIADLTRHSSYPAYHLHQHVGGYSAAKIRLYQDLMDATNNGSTSMPGTGLAMDLLNTKYIIANQPAEPTNREILSAPRGNLYERPTAMPRAWLVDSVAVVEEREALEMIANESFDPEEVALLTEPLGQTLDRFPEDETAASESSATDAEEPRTGTGSDDTAGANQAVTVPKRTAGRYVESVFWEAHDMEFRVNAPGRSMLVLSEIIYPPAWHASIDGEPAEILRTNYLLRGIVVPEGEHTVRLWYESEGHETGVVISLGLNILTILILGTGLFRWWKSRSAQEDTENDESRDDGE